VVSKIVIRVAAVAIEPFPFKNFPASRMVIPLPGCYVFQALKQNL
jgi:hypothetical protein